MTVDEVVEEFLKHEGVSSTDEYYEKSNSNTYEKLKQEMLRKHAKNDTLHIKSMTDDSDIIYSDKDIQGSFGIKSINDYVGVQKAVLNTLSEEGFFSDEHNVIVNSDSGMVIEITKDGIKETLGKDWRFEKLPRQLKELKLSAIRMLPSLIKSAQLVKDNEPNNHNSKSSLNYAYLAKDVTVISKGVKTKYTVTIAVRKSQQKNKFWMHEIRTTKKE